MLEHKSGNSLTTCKVNGCTTMEETLSKGLFAVGTSTRKSAGGGGGEGVGFFCILGRFLLDIFNSASSRRAVIAPALLRFSTNCCAIACQLEVYKQRFSRKVRHLALPSIHEWRGGGRTADDPAMKGDGNRI